MARVDMIRRAVLDLMQDLDALVGRVAGAEDVPSEVARRVSAAARQAREHFARQLARGPADFEPPPLLDWLNETRAKVGRARVDVARAPDLVGDYVERLREWAADLPGDGTTPPP